MGIKDKISTLWSANSTLIIKIAVGLVVVIALVVVGWWYAGRAVNQLAADLRAKAILDNRPLYDNLAVLKDRTQALESQYSAQRTQINTIRNNQRGATTNVFRSNDKTAIAHLFDNTVDGYIPSK